MENYEEDNEYLRELLERFENNTSQGSYSFFDSGELEDIIYHYFNEAEYAKALNAIEFAISYFPTETIFKVFMAQYFLNTGAYEKALSSLKKLHSLEPNNADIVLSLATAYSQMERPKEAIREYKRVLELTDEDADEVFKNIAFEYQNLNNAQEALLYFQRAYRYKPRKNASLLFEISYCYETLQKNEEGIQFFTDIIDKDPYCYEAWYNLGIIYNYSGLYEKAIDAFDFSIAIKPTYIPAYLIKAQMDMYKEAINTYKQSLDVEADDASVYYYIANCYAFSGNYDKALEYYRKALSLDRMLSNAWIGMGVSYVDMGQPAEALAHFQQGLKIEPDNVDYLILISGCYEDLSMNEAAEAAYRRAGELDPTHPDVWLDFSDFYVKTQNDYQKALDIIEEGAFHQGNNSELVYRRAAYLYLSGRVKEAIIELFIALTMDYKGHELFLEYNPRLQQSDEIIQAIQSFKNHTNISNN